MEDTGITRRTLHQQIEQKLRKLITDKLQPGQKLDPEVKLAERYDVSIATIREAITTFVHEGLIERRAGRGTVVRERQTEQPSSAKHVGVLVETDIACLRNSHFFLVVIQELQRFFRENGHRVRLYLGHRQPDEEPWKPTCAEFLDSVERQKLCGVVAVATYSHREWMDPLKKQHVPVVGTAPAYAFGVANDLAAVVRDGTRRLLEQGCRKIAWIGWKEFAMGQSLPDVQMQAFRETLHEFGAPLAEHWIRRDIPPALAGAGWAEFREIWTARAEKPDGLLVTDDVLFREAATAIVELGIAVPERLKVVTHANKGAPIFYPFAVDCLEYDPAAHARTLGEILRKLIRQEPVPEPQVTLPFRWVHRERMDTRLETTKTA